MDTKILIIGKDAYLADSINFESNFEVERIKRPFEDNFERYNNYDVIVNFCIQPEHFTGLLPESEMIDVNIAKNLKGNTKFIFLSSRKVYGSSCILKEYSETDKLKPFDFYSKNKVNIEKRLSEILGDNLLILRTSNIVGFPPKHNSPTFISWLESELRQNKRVVVTANPKARKDFISKNYFQFVLENVIKANLTGIYNVGAGFGISIEELMTNLVDFRRLKFEQKEERGEQFILNCDKLHQYIEPLTSKQLLETCLRVKEYMERNIV